jgi:hypothetical protein
LAYDSEIWHGLLTHKNRRIPTKRNIRGPHSPSHYEWKRGVFSKVVLGFRNLGYYLTWGERERRGNKLGLSCTKLRGKLVLAEASFTYCKIVVFFQEKKSMFSSIFKIDVIFHLPKY